MNARHDISTVLSRAPEGLEAPLVRVEVHLGAGLPAFALVGLPEAAVRESKERVRAALATAGFEFPVARITVNLSPADLPKEGGRFDLPIAIGILAAVNVIPPSAVLGREFYGELSLGGELRETRKLLPALIRGVQNHHEVILPAANALEAGLVGHANLKLTRRLDELVASLRSRQPLVSMPTDTAGENAAPTPVLHDLQDVRGQYGGKRALELAAAGDHGLLFMGPPGTGKTLLAQRLPGLLPRMSAEEALEVASLESAAGRRPSCGVHRPFRNPQHTASMAALIGGGAMRPGELSLAHRGVLFLDEFPEFPRNALEALREPMESGEVVLTRLKRSYRFPAQFQLIAAMNPCPCGYAGDPSGRCRCTPDQVLRYRNRISGPLADRIDMQVELTSLTPQHLLDDDDAAPRPESSAQVAARVAAARALQMARQGKLNARLSAAELALHCPISGETRALLSAAITRLGLSARAYHRVVKLARTAADLAGSAKIRVADVAEAVKLRVLDRPTC
jgi:magnesium chelatase family protein